MDLKRLIFEKLQDEKVYSTSQSAYCINWFDTLNCTNNAVVSAFLAERLLAHNGMASISPRDEIFVVLYENFKHLTPRDEISPRVL